MNFGSWDWSWSMECSYCGGLEGTASDKGRGIVGKISDLESASITWTIHSSSHPLLIIITHPQPLIISTPHLKNTSISSLKTLSLEYSSALFDWDWRPWSWNIDCSREDIKTSSFIHQVSLISSFVSLHHSYQATQKKEDRSQKSWVLYWIEEVIEEEDWTWSSIKSLKINWCGYPLIILGVRQAEVELFVLRFFPLSSLWSEIELWLGALESRVCCLNPFIFLPGEI